MHVHQTVLIITLVLRLCLYYMYNSWGFCVYCTILKVHLHVDYRRLLLTKTFYDSIYIIGLEPIHRSSLCYLITRGVCHVIMAFIMT